MIGINDIKEEVFSINDAGELLKFVQKTANITFLSFWSLNRDISTNPSEPFVVYKSSGVPQYNYDFSRVFNNLDPGKSAAYPPLINQQKEKDHANLLFAVIILF